MEKTFPIRTLPIPPLLREISDPPKSLYMRGVAPQNDKLFLAVVGSRKYTSYGKQVCEKLIRGLKGYPVVIVSGLALGMDGIAHRTALENGLQTIAVPGSGLDDQVLYPKTHLELARKILMQGGALISEFEPTHRARPENFPQRNRIMAGMSHAVLVIEAELRSGTLITSRLASEYNRDVCTVPGPIHSPTTQGPHMLIRNGATLIRDSADILECLGIDTQDKVATEIGSLSHDEEMVRQLLVNKPLSRDELIQRLELSTSEANVLLTSLELKGLIKEQLGVILWE